MVMHRMSFPAFVPPLAVFLAFGAAACRDEKAKYIHAAQLSQALAVVSRAKVYVSAYYDENGRWPTSNEEAGLSPAKDYASESIAGLTVSEDGALTVRFDEKSGLRDGFLRLTPTAGPPDVGIQWRCTTRGFKEITALVPQCHSED